MPHKEFEPCYTSPGRIGRLVGSCKQACGQIVERLLRILQQELHMQRYHLAYLQSRLTVCHDLQVAVASGLVGGRTSSMVRMDAVTATMLDALDDLTAIDRMCASKGLPSSQGNLSIMPCR